MQPPIKNPSPRCVVENLPDSSFSAGTPWDRIPMFVFWEDDETRRIQGPPRLPPNEPTAEDLARWEALAKRREWLELVLGKPLIEDDALELSKLWEERKDYFEQA